MWMEEKNSLIVESLTVARKYNNSKELKRIIVVEKERKYNSKHQKLEKLEKSTV